MGGEASLLVCIKIIYKRRVSRPALFFVELELRDATCASERDARRTCDKLLVLRSYIQNNTNCNAVDP